MADLVLRENYRDDLTLREAFFEFTKTIFGLNFKSWYERGYWEDPYCCVSLYDGERIVSNVSYSRMNVIVKGEHKRALQIATVGTLPEYRKDGLSRRLIEYVLEKHAPEVDFCFLFANDSVLEFYPKFGFERHYESVFVRDVVLKTSPSAKRLDASNPDDMALINRLIDSRMVLTERFGAVDYGFITRWHIVNLFPKRCYYLPDEDAVVVATCENGWLDVWDVISRKTIDVDAALAKLPFDRVETVAYYFAPDVSGYSYDRVEESADSPLFVRGTFNPGDEPFKFPATAQT